MIPSDFDLSAWYALSVDSPGVCLLSSILGDGTLLMFTRAADIMDYSSAGSCAFTNYFMAESKFALSSILNGLDG